MRHYNISLLTGLSGFLAVIGLFGLGLALSLGQPKPSSTGIGGPFRLVDDTGATVTDANLRGKPSAFYFGYTFCPEVCPTTLADMAQWIARLGPDAAKFNFVFVTVDPERDTVETLHSYLSSFDPSIRGYTGTPQQIADAARNYKVFYQRVPINGTYAMDHSTRVYLMRPNGEYFDSIEYQEDEKSALTKLRALLARG